LITPEEARRELLEEAETWPGYGDPGE